MPKVQHNILQWARETSKLSIEDAAHKLGIKDTKNASAADKLISLESGDKEPSRSIILRMSKQYHRPLLTFYLNEPPSIGDRGEDFRTLPEDVEDIENAHVDVLLRDIKARQSAVRETLIDADEDETLRFIGKYTIDAGTEKVVDEIRDTFRLSLDEYREQPNHKEAFRLLRQKAEGAGVYILLKGNLGSHHSNIAVKYFRGFALSDDIAPFIVLNDLDAESAWSFTLLHEMAHLILGKTGVSGEYAEKKIEKFCNGVASEYLLPASEFELFTPTGLDIDTLKTEVHDYACSLKLSSSHVAYRLYRRGDIGKSLWKDLSTYYHEKWLEGRRIIKEKSSQSEGGPSYYVVKQYKLGALVGLVERLTYSGALTTTKAGMVLEMKPLKVHQLFETGHHA